MKIIYDIKSARTEAKKKIKRFYYVVIPRCIKSIILILAIRLERLADKIRAER